MPSCEGRKLSLEFVKYLSTNKNNLFYDIITTFRAEMTS